MLKKILIAEDEKAIANALSIKLKGAGFEPVIVSNGQEAVDRSEKEDFDLIILDIVMPKMDGFEALKLIKQTKPQAKVVIASNLGQNSDIEKAKQLGAVDYFVKSNTSLAEIVNRLNNILK